MSVLRGCVTGNYIFITRFWELNKTNHQGTFWGMSSLKRIQSNLFFFFPLRTKSQQQWLTDECRLPFSPSELICSILERKPSCSCLCCVKDGSGVRLSLFFFFFLHFFFFFASSSDMASLGGGVSPSESFHPHQGSRAVTTGIRLITHSPRRLHK